MATVVIARAGGGDTIWALGMPDEVFIDDRKLGVISYHQAFKVQVPAGHHKLSVKQYGFTDPIPNYNFSVEFDCKEGEQHFFRVKTTIGLITGHPHLVPLEPEHKEHLLKAHPLDKIEERKYPQQ